MKKLIDFILKGLSGAVILYLAIYGFLSTMEFIASNTVVFILFMISMTFIAGKLIVKEL